MFRDYDPEKYVKITNRYGISGRLSPSIGIDGLNPMMVANTIFDPNLETKYGMILLPRNIPNRFLATARGIDLPEDRLAAANYIKTNFAEQEHELLVQPKQGVLVPLGINKIEPNTNGTMFMNPLQKAAYRLVSQVVSFSGAMEFEPDNRRKLHMELQSVDDALVKYFDEVAKILSSKDGLFRKAVHPRQKNGIFGVLVNRNDLDLDQVLLPRRAVKEWLRDDKYLKKVGIPPNYNLLDNESFDEYFKGQRILIMAMPDHDENCAMFLKMRLWSGNGIGLHPAIATTLYRDFDGDIVYGKVFDTKDVDEELMCLAPDTHLQGIKDHLTKCYKGIGKEARTLHELQQMIRARHEEVLFMSTDLEEAGTIENVKPEQELRFKQLIEGIPVDDVPAQQADSARDFFTIKYETANAGDMGNQMRIICSIQDRDAVRHANDFYHIVAQSALDSKHGSASISATIGRVLRSADFLPSTKEKLEVFLANNLGDTAYPELIKTIARSFYDGSNQKLGDISSINDQISTINSIIRGNKYKLLVPSTHNDFCLKMFKLILNS